MLKSISTIILSWSLIGFGCGPKTALSSERTLLEHPFYLFGLEGNLTASISLADIDNDGDADIIAANGRHWAQQNFIYLNNGDGRMLRTIPLGESRTPSYRVLTLNTREPTNSDFIVINDGLKIELFESSTDGTRILRSRELDSAGNARDAILNDLDADGYLELIVAKRKQQDIILWGDEEQTFTAASHIGAEHSPSTSVTAADLDSDGTVDLVFSARNGPVTVFYGQGTRQFLAGQPLAQGDFRSVRSADLDGDGHVDLVLGSMSGANLVLKNTLARTFETCANLGDLKAKTYSIAIADIDQDGRPDIIEGNDGTTNQWHRNLGGCRFESSAIAMEPAEVYDVQAQDLNGDGYPEVVFAISDGPNVIVQNRKR